MHSLFNPHSRPVCVHPHLLTAEQPAAGASWGPAPTRLPSLALGAALAVWSWGGPRTSARLPPRKQEAGAAASPPPQLWGPGHT